MERGSERDRGMRKRERERERGGGERERGGCLILSFLPARHCVQAS